MVIRYRVNTMLLIPTLFLLYFFKASCCCSPDKVTFYYVLSHKSNVHIMQNLSSVDSKVKPSIMDHEGIVFVTMWVTWTGTLVTNNPSTVKIFSWCTETIF